MSYEFPFTLQDVAHLCGIPIRGDKASEYITCPFCGRKKKMNLNYTKGQYNCPACGEGGHMLKLFAKLNGMSSSSNGEITNEIKRRLNIDYKPATPYKIRDIIIRDDVHEDTSMNIDLDKMLHYHSVYKSFIDKINNTYLLKLKRSIEMVGFRSKTIFFSFSSIFNSSYVFCICFCN